MRLFRLPDGRDLEYEVLGPSTGHTVVFHHGMPGSAVPMPTLLVSTSPKAWARRTSHSSALPDKAKRRCAGSSRRWP